MPTRDDHPRFTLSIRPSEQWTLHHVLLARLDAETSALADDGSPTDDGEPTDGGASAVHRAFRRLDAGHTRFTFAELEAVQGVLASSHHSPRWEVDRPRLERLLHVVSARLAAARRTHRALPDVTPAPVRLPDPEESG